MRALLRMAGMLLLAATWATGGALAQEFPRKQPIKIVVAANAGGGTDIRARVLAEFLQRRIGQAVVVENRPGAASMIGTDFVAKAAPDGYTLFFTAAEFAVLPAFRTDLPYKFDEFTFLAQVFRFQILMYGSPKLPVSTIPELIAHMKANPGKVRYGTTGVGAVVHLGLAMFESAAGVKGTHVPYTGIAPVYTDMLAGNVDITQATPPPTPGIKVLGNVGTKRIAAFPDLPTLEEQGIKGASWDIWFGFVAPPKLPKPIADRLIADIEAVMKDPEAIAKLATIQAEPDVMTGDAFRQMVVNDHKRFREVVEREKLTMQ
jgi:tripartite-type tricarboxylate transporter receptor subunit TctC